MFSIKNSIMKRGKSSIYSFKTFEDGKTSYKIGSSINICARSKQHATSHSANYSIPYIVIDVGKNNPYEIDKIIRTKNIFPSDDRRSHSKEFYFLAGFCELIEYLVKNYEGHLFYEGTLGDFIDKYEMKEVEIDGNIDEEKIQEYRDLYPDKRYFDLPTIKKITDDFPEKSKKDTKEAESAENAEEDAKSEEEKEDLKSSPKNEEKEDTESEDEEKEDTESEDEEKEEEKTKLRDYQEDAVTEIKRSFFVKNEKSAVVSSITGSGKTYIFLWLMMLLTNMRFLVLTKRKDVFINIREKCEKIFPENDLPFISVGGGKKALIKARKSRCAIMNIDSVIKYKKFMKEFDMIIIDECQWATAPNTLVFFLEFLKIKGKYLLGFSATVMRTGRYPEFMQLFRSKTGKPNIVYNYTYIEGIADKIIVPIIPDALTFSFDDFERMKSKDKTRTFYTLTKERYEEALKFLHKYILKSVYKKGILYFPRTKICNEFYNWFCDYFMEKYGIELIVSHSSNDLNGKNIGKFHKKKEKAILCVVDRAEEGFDDERVDLGVRFYYVANEKPERIVQRAGRLTRVDKKGLKKEAYIISIEKKENVKGKVEFMARAIKNWFQYMKIEEERYYRKRGKNLTQSDINRTKKTIETTFCAIPSLSVYGNDAKRLFLMAMYRDESNETKLIQYKIFVQEKKIKTLDRLKKLLFEQKHELLFKHNLRYSKIISCYCDGVDLSARFLKINALLRYCIGTFVQDERELTKLGISYKKGKVEKMQYVPRMKISINGMDFKTSLKNIINILNSYKKSHLIKIETKEGKIHKFIYMEKDDLFVRNPDIIYESCWEGYLDFFGTTKKDYVSKEMVKKIYKKEKKKIKGVGKSPREICLKLSKKKYGKSRKMFPEITVANELYGEELFC